MNIKTVNATDKIKDAKLENEALDNSSINQAQPQFKGFNSREQTRNSIVKLVSFISGIVCGLCMPGYDLTIMAWVGFIPLFLMLNYSKTIKESSTISFLFGFGFNLLSLNWFLGLHPLNWIGISTNQSIALVSAIWLGVAAYCSIFTLLVGILSFKVLKTDLNIVLKSILVSFCWILANNFLMSIGPLAFPWAMIEYSQYENTNLLQLAHYAKGTGIGFIIILSNLFLSSCFNNSNVKKLSINYKRMSLTALFIVVIHICGYFLQFISKDDAILDSAIIQSSVSIEEEKKGYISIKDIKSYVINKVSNIDSSLVVIPEALINDFIRQNDRDFINKLNSISAKQNKTIIVGALDLKKSKEKTKAYNAAMIFSGGYIKDLYYKQSLVPFGEFIPGSDFLPSPVKSCFANMFGIEFSRGSSIVVTDTINGNIAPSICYDIIFPDLIRKQAQKGADIFVNLSNLAWFHDSKVKDQFIAAAVLRSAENKIPFIVAINSGYSVFIDSDGRIIKKLPKNIYVDEKIKVGLK